MSVDIFAVLKAWEASLEGSLEAAGVTVASRAWSGDRPKNAYALNLCRGSVEVDLVLWDSGEGELGMVLEDGEVVEEHLEGLLSPLALGEVLERMLRTVGIPSGS